MLDALRERTLALRESRALREEPPRYGMQRERPEKS